MSDFHIDARTARRLVVKLGFTPNRFTSMPNPGDKSLFGVNFRLQHTYHMTRSNKPRRKLNFEQVVMLLMTPVEAHSELIKSF